MVGMIHKGLLFLTTGPALLPCVRLRYQKDGQDRTNIATISKPETLDEAKMYGSPSFETGWIDI
jgi:hypothetical protein